MVAHAAALAALARGRGWSRAELLEFQAVQLRRLVEHAGSRVPFHRDRLSAAAIDPSRDVRALADLERLPLTSKAELQPVEARALVAEPLDVDRLVCHVTSGSTGRPFAIRRTRLEEELLAAFRLRELRHWGLRPWDLRAQLASLRPPAGWQGEAPPPKRLHQRLGVLRQRWIHSLQTPGELARSVIAARPAVVHGYPSTLDAIAAMLDVDDRRRLALRFVSCAGETLFPEVRRRIEEGFGTRLFDIYGTHETNIVAVECVATGRLHVIEEAILVEVLRTDGRPALEGEEGEVVITPLHSYAMPFLRFRLGDLAVRGPTPCPCGAPVATLERVTGRTIELFVLPDGRRVHPYHILRPMLASAPWIRQFRIVQEETRRITISVVPVAMPSAESRDQAARAIESALGGGVTIEFAMVERIEAPPGKKLNPYECRVRPST